MPRVLVCHFDASDEVRRKHLEASSTQQDDFGVLYRNVFATEDGHVFCVAEMPGIHNLLVSHREHGIPMSRSDVHYIWHGTLATQ